MDANGGTAGRMPAKRKQSAVLRLLRGEDLELLSREHADMAAELGAWRDAFLAGGHIPAGRRARRRDRPPQGQGWRVYARVIAPDLQGLGDTSRPGGGYDKRTVAADLWQLMHDHLGHDVFHLVGHDWGGPTA